MKRFGLILLGCLLNATAHAGEPGVEQTIAYVKKLQTENGGFRAQQPKPGAPEIVPTLGATSSALRALRYFGAEVPNKEACVKFVESCYDPKSGGFRQTPDGKPDVFTTAVGLMAVVELKMPLDKYADGASKYLSDNAKTFEEIRIAAAGFEAIKRKAPQTDKWFNDIARTQNKDGTFGKDAGQARDTASAEVTMHRLVGPPAEADRFIKVFKDGQRQNGGWGKADSEIASDLETTYRVMRCFVMLKARPANVEGVRSFVAKCRNEDGGYAVAPGQPSSVSGTYFASIILHWLKD
jgi:hypothetical protein